MKIKWLEDLSGGTNERPVWAIKGTVGDVAVERRSDVTLNASTRRLENMRLEVLDGIRAGLGLPQDAIREEDITGGAEAMSALRRMALEAERTAPTKEEPDTIEAVMTEWNRGPGSSSRAAPQYPSRFIFYDEDDDPVAGWEQSKGFVCVPGGGWTPGTLNDLRRTLGLEARP